MPSDGRNIAVTFNLPWCLLHLSRQPSSLELREVHLSSWSNLELHDMDLSTTKNIP
jgi:hypothetical protein